MRINKKYVGTALGCLALLSLVPHYAPPYWVAFLFFCLIYIAICEMWVLITRAGMVLLGIYGFVGMGVYALVIFSTCLGYPLWISILLSGIIGVVLGLVVAPSIFKMRGQYFSMGSIVIAKALSAWFETWSYTGGGAGININANVSVTVLYYLGLALAVFSVLAVLLILRSKLGLMLKAIGNDEDAANTVGVNTFFVKLRCFILASFIIGIAGSMYFLYPVFVTPSSAFSPVWLINTLTAASIGGWGNIEGAILGVIVVVSLQQFFYVNYPGFSLLINGLVIVTAFMLARGGLWPTIRDIIEKKLKRKTR